MTKPSWADMETEKLLKWMLESQQQQQVAQEQQQQAQQIATQQQFQMAQHQEQQQQLVWELAAQHQAWKERLVQQMVTLLQLTRLPRLALAGPEAGDFLAGYRCNSAR